MKEERLLAEINVQLVQRWSTRRQVCGEVNVHWAKSDRSVRNQSTPITHNRRNSVLCHDKCA